MVKIKGTAAITLCLSLEVEDDGRLDYSLQLEEAALEDAGLSGSEYITSVSTHVFNRPELEELNAELDFTKLDALLAERRKDNG